LKVLGVIPARYASTRLPGKPLVDICGKPMIEHVYHRAAKASCLNELLVATDDERIIRIVEGFGGKAVLTSTGHNSGTDRAAEIAQQTPDIGIVINIQGDEPLLDPRIINQIASPFSLDPSIIMVTAARLLEDTGYEDPNVVKVTMNLKGDALYFSRSLIPYPRIKDNFRVYEHVGIYGYRRDFLLHLAGMPRTPLETTESLEQLRVMENGYAIRIVVTEYADKSVSVDTPGDLERVRCIMAQIGE